jgi:hypothetical protein
VNKVLGAACITTPHSELRWACALTSLSDSELTLKKGEYLFRPEPLREEEGHALGDRLAAPQTVDGIAPVLLS